MGLRLKHLLRDALRRGARFYLISLWDGSRLRFRSRRAADAVTAPAEASAAVR